MGMLEDLTGSLEINKGDDSSWRQLDGNDVRDFFESHGICTREWGQYLALSMKSAMGNPEQLKVVKKKLKTVPEDVSSTSRYRYVVTVNSKSSLIYVNIASEWLKKIVALDKADLNEVDELCNLSDDDEDDDTVFGLFLDSPQKTPVRQSSNGDKEWDELKQLLLDVGIVSSRVHNALHEQWHVINIERFQAFASDDEEVDKFVECCNKSAEYGELVIRYQFKLVLKKMGTPTSRALNFNTPSATMPSPNLPKKRRLVPPAPVSSSSSSSSSNSALHQPRPVVSFHDELCAKTTESYARRNSRRLNDHMKETFNV